jgi:hypothetical protein
MTADELKKWQARLGLSNVEAARRLNKTSLRTFEDWRAGRSTPPRCLPLALKEVERVLKLKRSSVAVEQNAAPDALRARSSRSGRG